MRFAYGSRAVFRTDRAFFFRNQKMENITKPTCERNAIIPPVMAELQGNTVRKTGLAAGSNFLINHVATRSAPVANPDPSGYLAINWQQADLAARFASEDRRFP